MQMAMAATVTPSRVAASEAAGRWREGHRARRRQRVVEVLRPGHGEDGEADGDEIAEQRGRATGDAADDLDHHQGGVEEGHHEEVHGGLEGDEQSADQVAPPHHGQTDDGAGGEEPESEGEAGQVAGDLGRRAHHGAADPGHELA